MPENAVPRKKKEDAAEEEEQEPFDPRSIIPEEDEKRSKVAELLLNVR